MDHVVEKFFPIAPGYVCHRYLDKGGVKIYPVVALGLDARARPPALDWRAVIIDESGRPVICEGKVTPVGEPYPGSELPRR